MFGFFSWFWIVMVNWEERYQGSEIQNLPVMLQYSKGHCFKRSVLPLQWKLLSWCWWVGSVWPLLESVNLHFPLLLLFWHAGIGIWWRNWFRKGLALDSVLSGVCPSFCDQFLSHRLAVASLVYSWDHMKFLCFIKCSPVMQMTSCIINESSSVLRSLWFLVQPFLLEGQFTFNSPLIDSFIKIFQICPDRE